MRVFVAALVVAMTFAACGGEPPVITITFEEAALVSLGEMFRRYPDGADPFPETVTGTVVDFDGRAAWKVDGAYAVTVEGVRRIDHWMLWVVAGEGRHPAIVRADGPDDLSDP